MNEDEVADAHMALQLLKAGPHTIFQLGTKRLGRECYGQTGKHRLQFLHKCVATDL